MRYKTLKKILNKFPYVRAIYQENNDLKKSSHFPAGHYYSPIVSLKDVEARESEIWRTNLEQDLEGIDLNITMQRYLLDKFSYFYSHMPFTSEPERGLRYFFENSFYSYTDGIILYSLIRYFQPEKIVEIGSGFSSALMLDVNEIFFENSIALTFIEPYPKRLQRLLRENDKEKCTIIKQKVQDVEIKVFKVLNEGDILFVDSSHVVKTASDVNHILFQILPTLKKGVIIHFHDIFFPFEYPKEWVFRGYNWNESYLLKAFLMHNDQYEILLFSDYMHKFYKADLKSMPLTLKNTGGNLWIRKK